MRQAVETMGATYDVVALPRRFASTGEYGRHPVVTAGKLIASLPGLIRYSRRLRRHLQRWQPDLVHANGLKGHILSAWVVSGRMRLLWHVHDYVSPRAISAALFRQVLDDVPTRSSPIRKASPRMWRGVLGGGRSVEGPPQRHRLHAVFAGGAFDGSGCGGRTCLLLQQVLFGLAWWRRTPSGRAMTSFLMPSSRLPPGLPVRAYVVGGPAYQVSASQWTRADLIRRASDLGLDGRIGFLDFQADTSPVYRALDVVVHASTAPEPFGLVIAEAMSCGRLGRDQRCRRRAGNRGPGADVRCASSRRRPGPGATDGKTGQRRRVAGAAWSRGGRWPSGRRFSRQQMGDALHAIYQGMSDGRAG